MAGEANPQKISEVNWVLVLEKTYTRKMYVKGGKSYYKIEPALEVFGSNTLLMRATSYNAKSHWRLGAFAIGHVNIIKSPIFPPIQLIPTFIRTTLILGELKIATYENYGNPNINVLFEFPHWLKDVTLEVWEPHVNV